MWESTLSAPEGRAVMTKIDDSQGVRNETVLVKSGNLWFDGDMYVYYKPTHWRELSLIEKMRIRNDNERKAIDQMERANATLD